MIGRFAWSLLGWTFLCMLIDGFDFAGISFVIPAIAREWHVAVGSFGWVLGIGVFGLMVGSIIFGWVGDRIGRKKTIILGCWLFGGFTLASIWAPSIGVLMWLRFLAGRSVCRGTQRHRVGQRVRAAAVACDLGGADVHRIDHRRGVAGLAAPA